MQIKNNAIFTLLKLQKQHPTFPKMQKQKVKLELPGSFPEVKNLIQHPVAQEIEWVVHL